MGKVGQIIRGRPVFLLAHGGSTKELELKVKEFRNRDICWVSLGLFTIMEKYILSQIDKKLDIVFDCASVPDGRRKNYELKVRFPRLEEFLKRSNPNLWITTNGIIRDSVNIYNPSMHNYEPRTYIVDDIFPAREIGKWMDVPNSVTLCIAVLLAGGASKIFLFGVDGYTGDVKQGLQECYCPEEIKTERMAALGSEEDPGINRDTNGFETRFPTILQQYRKLFGNNAPIYNVSQKSVYTVLPKIEYEEVKKLV